MFYVVLLLYFTSLLCLCTGSPCSLLDGTSQQQLLFNIIESQGVNVSSSTIPDTIPLEGDIEKDIVLTLHDSSYFKLNGKKLVLQKPLDRDKEDLSFLSFSLTCMELNSKKKRTFPVLITISDINDNAPVFYNTPYSVTVKENLSISSVVFAGLKAKDIDAHVNGQIEYSIIPGDGSSSDGYGVFEIHLPHQGIVTLHKPLDYETTKIYNVTIVASDMSVENKLSTHTTLTVHVIDVDDLNPKFVHESYVAETISGSSFKGALALFPEKIQAYDQDELKASLFYSFKSGFPNSYNNFFVIDSLSGVLTQIAPLDKFIERFDIILLAKETSGRSAEANLTIKVLPEDVNPPVVKATAIEGYVNENSEVGTYVTDVRGERIVFSITDADVETIKEDNYSFEMTTSYFEIDENRFLIVKKPNLDHDPPFAPILDFQIFIREKEGSRKSSSPIFMKIHIRDLNDNAPILSSVNDVFIVAGSHRRQITRLNATDIDSEPSLIYKLLHVSNNGRHKFALNTQTGVIDVIAPVFSGESFSLTVAALDSGGLESKTIFRVYVQPSPNIYGPSFEQYLYEVSIPEDAEKYTSVLTLVAKDPEKDPVKYFIVQGNENESFHLEEATGVLRVMKPLDRENISSYSFTIKAEDSDHKFGTTSVHIEITDVNDEIPQFIQLPYTFEVVEGDKESLVGRVMAIDSDKGSNSEINYFLDSLSEEFFTINSTTGYIKTKKALDFEKQNVHNITVIARDKAALSVSATATIVVTDIQDEIPFFSQSHIEVKVPENIPDYVITTVEAQDSDNISSITYRLMEGDPNLFFVHSKTGILKTLRGLDYEKSQKHIVVLGTEEWFHSGVSSNNSTTMVTVQVEDSNDVPPIFTSVPRGHTLIIRNDVSLGEKIGFVRASDFDGTEPGNIVRYSLLTTGSSEKAEQYFRVDEVDGDIFVIDTLSKEIDEEYHLEIQAYDKGTPRLNTSILLLISVTQVVTMSPESGIGFKEIEITSWAKENLISGSVLGIYSLFRKSSSSHSFPIKCQITSAKDKNGTSVIEEFSGIFHDNGTCSLVLNHPILNYESNNYYELEMKLDTHSAFVNPNAQNLKIHLHVSDENDNSPTFVYNHTYNTLLPSTYLAFISKDIDIGTEIFKVNAIDYDTGNNGRLQYELSAKDVKEGIFQIHPNSGVVSNKIKLTQSSFPFILEVIVKDSSEDFRTSRTTLNIHDVDINDSLVLTISNAEPKTLLEQRQELTKALEEHTGTIIHIVNFLPSMVKYSNGTCCKYNKDGTDVYFHAMNLNSSMNLTEKYNSHLLNKEASSQLKYAISSRLSLQVSELHEPYVKFFSQETKMASSSSVWYPHLLIALASSFFLLSFLFIIYLIISRQRIQNSYDKQEKMIVIPRYEPVFVEPTSKEYETQVLQMSVPNDDEYGLGFKESKSSFLHLDTISYITKEDHSSLSQSTEDFRPSTSSTFSY